MRNMIFMIFLGFTSICVFSNEIDFKKEEINKKLVPKPEYTTEKEKEPANQQSGILTYQTDETFPFESDAKKECSNKLNIFKELSISVIGCNVLPRGNDYTYTIDYIPELKNPDSIKSIIIEEYKSPKNYWNENLSKAELNKSLSKFAASPFKVFDSKIIEVENEYSFSVKYVNENILKKSKTYYISFEKAVYGKYTFESDAKKDIQNVINKLKQIGISAVGGKAIENGNDYSIEIEYVNKVDNLSNPSKNPLYSISNYFCEETFPFEDNALKEGEKRNQSFSKAGINVIHNWAYPIDNDWSFSTDFAVKNIYKNGNFISKEFYIKRYTNSQDFDFENEAKKSMEEKVNNFNNAGLYVVSSKVYETGNNYSFYIDYIEKQNIPKSAE